MIKRNNNIIWVIDCGSQYTQLIARRIRELKVYSEIKSVANAHQDLLKGNVEMPSGIIISGGPESADENSDLLKADAIFESNIPLLAICYGLQCMVKYFGGSIEINQHREYGLANLQATKYSLLFGNTIKIGDQTQVWMSHQDKVSKLPKDFQSIGYSQASPYAAIANEERKMFGLQFHPEVSHTEKGKELLKRFIFDIAKAQATWSMEKYHHQAIDNIRKEVGDGTVICGLSGGIDSAVTAKLVHEAIGDKLHCILVDHGLMRYQEVEEVQKLFGEFYKVPLVCKKAHELFFSGLKGVTDPEQKRKIIGKLFIDVFDQAATNIQGVTHLAQGTIYPDIIESAAVNKSGSALIKSHHNVGGLPDDLNFKLVEPIKGLFKDEVRLLGHEIGLPSNFIGRHPFPGPGLGIRVLGKVTPEKVKILSLADHIYLDEIRKAGLYDEIWQAFAVLLPVQSVGVMGDMRTYENVCALRAVTSIDGMTADVYEFPQKFLASVARRIINEVRGINRVTYDYTSKPPGTIEWE